MNMKIWVKQYQRPGIFNKLSNIRNLMIPLMMLGIFSLALSGCGGGGGSGSGSKAVPEGKSTTLIEGMFVDSPVEGLDYQTETHMGMTDADGRFTCLDDEMITFMLGDVMMGQVMAGEIITPLDFLDDSAEPGDLTNPMVINMGRFLQSLDADGNPENGITITEEVKNEISGRMINFNQSVDDFANDPDVLACFEMMNALNMPHNGMMWELIPEDQARQHMIAHMSQYMNGSMGSGSSGSDTGDSGSMMGGDSGSMMGGDSGSMMGGDSGSMMGGSMNGSM